MYLEKGILYYIPFCCNSAGWQAIKEEDNSYKDLVYSFSYLFEILIPEVSKHQIFLFYTSSLPRSPFISSTVVFSVFKSMFTVTLNDTFSGKYYIYWTLLIQFLRLISPCRLQLAPHFMPFPYKLFLNFMCIFNMISQDPPVLYVCTIKPPFEHCCCFLVSCIVHHADLEKGSFSQKASACNVCFMLK